MSCGETSRAPSRRRKQAKGARGPMEGGGGHRMEVLSGVRRSFYPRGLRPRWCLGYPRVHYPPRASPRVQSTLNIREGHNTQATTLLSNYPAINPFAMQFPGNDNSLTPFANRVNDISTGYPCLSLHPPYQCSTPPPPPPHRFQAKNRAKAHGLGLLRPEAGG